MPVYIHTKIFFLFVGLFELLFGLYLLITTGLELETTLAKLLIFSGVINLTIHSLQKAPKIVYFLLSLFAGFPLILLLLPSLALKDFYQAIPLLLIVLGLIISPFFPKNPLAKYKYHFFPVFIAILLIFSSPVFFLSQNILYQSFSLAMLLSGLLLASLSLYSPLKNRSTAYFLSAFSLQAFTLHGYLSNLPILVLFSLTASIFLLGRSFFKQIYSLKNLNKETDYHQKISQNLETIFWLSTFVIILVTVLSPYPIANPKLPLILVSFASLFTIVFFHFLPSSVYSEKNLPLGLAIYNVFSLLIVFATGGFTSPLLFLLVFFILISGVYLKRHLIFIPLALDLGSFLGFFIITGTNRENFTWFILNSLLLTLIAFVIFKFLEIKNTFQAK